MKLLRDQSAGLRTRSPVAHRLWLRPVLCTLTLLCKVGLRRNRWFSRGSLRRALHLGLLATLPERVTDFLKILLVVFTGIAVLPAPALAGDVGRTARPVIEIANPGKCIAPVEEMRRNHMDMLKHQRDRTMRQGIRGEPASLNACIECHAGKKSGSVLGASDSGKGTNFCESCHSYAAVKLDCFECHQPKAGFKATGVKP